MRKLTMLKLVAVLAMVAACPMLHAAPPRDGLGVAVDFGNATLIHRPPVTYPEAARTNHVEGTVLAQASVDNAGIVTDARIISGPDELRKGVLQSVLQWHFKPGSAGSAYQVSVSFQVVDPPPAAVAVPTVIQPSPADAEYRSIQNQMSMLSQQSRDNPTVTIAQLRELSARMQALQKIGSINLYGIYEDGAKDLISNLPLHVGDAPSTEKMTELTAAVKKFDEHLMASLSISATSPSEIELRVIAPGSEVPQQIKVGVNVQNANVIKRVAPVYPPEAKAAGVQGLVKLNATIAREGNIKTLVALSGDPALVPAAMDAVKQWVYKPTMLNGNPVEVNSDIEVNFTLSK